LAKKRIEELKGKLASDPGINIAKGYEKAKSKVENLDTGLAKLRMELVKAQATHEKMTAKYQKAETALFELGGGGWNNNTKKWPDIQNKRNEMAKAQNSTVAQDKVIGKLFQKITQDETALQRAKEALNEAHYHQWKPEFYQQKIKQVEGHIAQLQSAVEAEEKKKKKADDTISDAEAALPDVMQAGKSQSAYATLVKDFYENFVKVIDTYAMNTIKQGNMKVTTLQGVKHIKDTTLCSSADLSKAICNYVTRKKNGEGFSGLPNDILDRFSYVLPNLMDEVIAKDGPVSAAKNPKRFDTIKEAFKQVFSDKQMQATFEHKANNLYSECVFNNSPQDNEGKVTELDKANGSS